MTPTNCQDGLDCPHYHICNEDDVEADECPLTELENSYDTAGIPVDWLFR